MSSQLWWYTARSAGIVGAPGGERLVGSRLEHQGLRQAVQIVHAEQHDLATRPPTTVAPGRPRWWRPQLGRPRMVDRSTTRTGA